MLGRYFLACCIMSSCFVSEQTLIYVLQGDKFHLKPDIPEQPDNILWKLNGNKVVEFDGKEQHVYGEFQYRVTLDWVSAELNITDIRYNDSGDYELEIYTKKFSSFHYKLQVIGRVLKPTISCLMNNGSSNTHGAQATLTCDTQPQSSMEYVWNWDGNVLSGPNLEISLENEHDNKTYTCRVSNHLTSEIATFTAKNCYPVKSSSASLIVALSIIFIIIMLVILATVICKLKRKACFAEKNTEPLRNDLRDLEKALLESSQHPKQTASTHNPNVGHKAIRKEKNPDKDNKPVSPPRPRDRKTALYQDPHNTKETNQQGKNNDKDDAEADQSREQSEKKVPESDSEKANEPDQACVLNDGEDTESDVESSTAPKPPEKNPDKDNKPVSPPRPRDRKTTLYQDPHNTKETNQQGKSNDKDDAEADQSREQSEKKVPESDSEKANEPDQACVLNDGEDTESDVESSIAPKPPAFVLKLKMNFEGNAESIFPPNTQTEKNPDKDNKPVSPPRPRDRKTTLYQDPHNTKETNQQGKSNDKDDAEADQSREQSEKKVPESDSEKANEPDQVRVLNDGEDTESDVESSIAPKPPVSDLENIPDEDKKPVPPPRPLVRNPYFCQDSDNLSGYNKGNDTKKPNEPHPGNDKGDAEAESDVSETKNANEPDQLGVLDCSEST